MNNDDLPVVKVQVEVSFPHQAQLKVGVGTPEMIGISAPSDGATCTLGPGNTLTVSGMVIPASLATAANMKAWVSHELDNNVLNLNWSPPPPAGSNFNFTLAGIVDNTFVGHWVVVNVTASDAGSNTLLGKSISILLQAPPPLGVPGGGAAAADVPATTRRRR